MKNNSDKKRFAVAPLGKYGRTYYLNERWFKIYRLYSVITYSIAAVFAAFEFVFKDFYLNVLMWPRDLPFILLIVVATIGLSGQLAIASRSKDETPVANAVVVQSRAKNIVIALVLAICVIVWALVANSLVSEIIRGQQTHKEQWILLALFSLGLLVVLKRFIKK
jgi:membrane protease YdiL (CAAX protease family)